MPNSKLAGCVRIATDADHTVRADISRAWAELEAKGVCPTCREIETGEATATDQRCEKVYQVTMCSGALSHLHFQLRPRQPGERIGGGVFSAPRMALGDARPLAAAVIRALEQQSGSKCAGATSVQDSR